MFPRHDQLYVGSRAPPSGILTLFSILPFLSSSLSIGFLTQTPLPLPRVAYGGFPTGAAIWPWKRERVYGLGFVWRTFP